MTSFDMLCHVTRAEGCHHSRIGRQMLGETLSLKVDSPDLGLESHTRFDCAMISLLCFVVSVALLVVRTFFFCHFLFFLAVGANITSSLGHGCCV
eukprot:88847-Amphidinium_carterae.1